MQKAALSTSPQFVESQLESMVGHGIARLQISNSLLIENLDWLYIWGFVLLFVCLVICFTPLSVGHPVGRSGDWRMGDLGGSVGYLAAHFQHHAAHF